MKYNFTLFIWALSLLFGAAYAAETEPNNTKAQANTLALNGSNSGNISPAGDVDWWKITTDADGKLEVTLSITSGKYVWVYLYDNDGITEVKSQYGSSTFTMSADGLAAGTYYLKVNCYYSTDLSPYAISNQLVLPAQANDVEPNNTKSTAKVLPLNATKTGHIGYYYNLVRDTFDWYKVTTDADGLLKLSLTPSNGAYVWVYLYDNDGTTLLNSSYSNSAFFQQTDGLAAGTYYVRINCYYNNQFAPYELKGNLTPASVANDAEPNNSRAQAQSLATNASATGHVGYYYNKQRDTADWYKITTNDDGLLKLSLTPINGAYVWVYLYDNDGTTLLNSSYSNSAFFQQTDGLAAGTYYVRINCFYNNQFAPYVLKDSLFDYATPADAESNARPYLANTLPANEAAPGHVGFYYKNQRDSVDWWKINYTGGGALSVTLNLQPTNLGSNEYTWMEVYKDTNATPIFSSYTLTTLQANLSSLQQGYYWVRVRTYYNNRFITYTLTPTFTQSNIAKIKAAGKTIAPDCSETNQLKLKVTGSKPPYTVQLYRYGVAYGSPRIVNNSNAFTYNNLPPGVYRATAYGDGATGTAFTAVSATFVPVPTVLSVTNIQTTKARLNWNTEPCVKYYQVQYRAQGTTTWKTKKTNGNVGFIALSGLVSGTPYEWHVAAADSANGVSGLAPYSVLDSFTTAGAKTADLIAQKATPANVAPATTGISITTYPNPAATQLSINLSSSLQGQCSLWLRDMTGKTVWSRQEVPLQGASNVQVDVSRLAPGMYLLQVADEETGWITEKKIIVAR